jgi:hypothetical protein
VAVAIAVVVSSCSSGRPGNRLESVGSTSTTSPGPVDTIVAYPPMPRPSSEAAQDCTRLASVGLTAASAEKITKAVTASAKPGQLLGIGACPGGPVVVQLTPGNESFAHELSQQYGHQVSLTVGLTAYDGSPGRSPRCGVLAAPYDLPTGLHLSLNLPAAAITSGSTFTPTVTVREDGPGTFTMDTGQPIEAVIVRPGTLQVVGVFSGAIAGTGFSVDLRAGESKTIPVIGGTARCDGGIGSALPAGLYDVIVRVAPETEPQTPSYLTEPVPLRVT